MLRKVFWEFVSGGTLQAHMYCPKRWTIVAIYAYQEFNTND